MKGLGCLRVAAVVATLGCVLSCSTREKPASRPGAPQADAVPEVVSRHRGQVLVLLLGMPGCPGTEKATPYLAEYARAMPDGVAVVRLDVPPPGEKLEGLEGGDQGFPREIDAERRVADRLEFFYYPTLYIFDAEGEERFQGGCEPGRLEEMVAAILAEKPGDEKRVFTPPLPEVGSAAPDFSGVDLGGNAVTLAGLRGKKATLLFFGSPDCPYSARATSDLPALAEMFGPMGVALAVVNVGDATDRARALYSKSAAGIAVVSDPKREISEGGYGVRTAPFLYVLDATGKIAARRPFTLAAAMAELSGVLGLAACEATAPSSGAG